MNRETIIKMTREPDMHIGACITDGVLHATVMRREANGNVTTLATAEMTVASLERHDCISKMAKPAQEVGLTEAERVRCLIASGCIGTVKMTYDSGPYEITRTSINASRLIDAIIAALREKGGK